MKHLIWLLMLALASPMMLSCGSDDDDGGGGQQREEDTGGGTSGGSSGGTSGGTGGGSPTACVSTTNRNNIKTVLDRLADFQVLNAAAVLSLRNPDGTFSDAAFVGPLSTRATSATSWFAAGQLCNSELCIEVDYRAAFSSSSGCFLSDGFRAQIISTSSNRIHYNTRPDSQTRIEHIITVTDKLTFSETIFVNGVATQIISIDARRP